MSSLAVEYPPRAHSIKCTDAELFVFLTDGRSLSVPVVWFPRLASASPSQRENYEFIADGVGIHWPDLDEDISVEGLLAGRASVVSEHANVS